MNGETSLSAVPYMTQITILRFYLLEFPQIHKSLFLSEEQGNSTSLLIDSFLYVAVLITQLRVLKANLRTKPRQITHSKGGNTDN
jgi:hypothetical protein